MSYEILCWDCVSQSAMLQLTRGPLTAGRYPVRAEWAPSRVFTHTGHSRRPGAGTQALGLQCFSFISLNAPMGKLGGECHASGHRWLYLRLQGQRRLPGGWGPASGTCLCFRGPDCLCTGASDWEQTCRASRTSAVIRMWSQGLLDHQSLFEGKPSRTPDMESQ